MISAPFIGSAFCFKSSLLFLLFVMQVTETLKSASHATLDDKAIHDHVKQFIGQVIKDESIQKTG
jgi:hypothetical protein